MKDIIIKSIESSIKKIGGSTTVELTPSRGHGDFSTNVAMKLAKQLGDTPQNIGQKIIKNLEKDLIEKAELAGPGFINIFLNSNATSSIVKKILVEDNNFGRGNQNKYINLEFLSANPTGHLHVGHARGAAVGASLANILKFAGNKVDTEYYINDAGNQIDTLGISAFVRYQQELGAQLELPEDSYKGNDIIEFAKYYIKKYGDKFKGVPYEEVKNEFKEDAKKYMLDVIKAHLENMDIKFDLYFSEQSLYNKKLIIPTINKLKEKSHTYEKDGALWLRTTDQGDDKDRVLIKNDNSFTYFSPDIAYHDNKLSRGYDELINIWGADHIGYIKRMEVALNFLGLSADKLDIFTIQLVKLIKKGKELKMSKRAGTTFSLNELIKLVGKDAVRFHMINRANTSQFDFILEDVVKQSSDNPVFTIKYTHARANQLLEKSSKKFTFGKYQNKEIELINLLNKFPELIESMAQNHKVHLLPQYLIDVVGLFNSFYSNTKIIGEERESDLLSLVKATKIVIKNGLKLIGVDAPESM